MSNPKRLRHGDHPAGRKAARHGERRLAREEELRTRVSQHSPCPTCGRIMSDRELLEQGACNDCSGGPADLG